MNSFLVNILKPRAWTAKFLLILSLCSFLTLGFLGYLQPIKAFLDSEILTFYVGSIKFSAYLLTKSTITIVILLWLIGIFSEFGERRIKKAKHLKSSNKNLIIKTFHIFVYLLAFFIGLDVLGIDMTSLAIFSGAIGLGLAFGLQKITSNFISGLILLVEKSIENDDLLELEDGTYGYVLQTRARYTLLETLDGKEIMIPNEDFITNRVINWTYNNSKARIEIKVGISYDSDVEKAMQIMLESAKEHPRCIEDPAPECFLLEFADSSINFTLFLWVSDVTAGRYPPKSDIMRAIWAKFKDNNITIPFPQHDLHIKNPEAFQ